MEIKQKNESATEIVAAKKRSAAPVKYSKVQLLSSKKYLGQRDIVEVILEDGKTYTTTQVDSLIKNFLERRV